VIRAKKKSFISSKSDPAQNLQACILQGKITILAEPLLAACIRAEKDEFPCFIGTRNTDLSSRVWSYVCIPRLCWCDDHKRYINPQGHVRFLRRPHIRRLKNVLKKLPFLCSRAQITFSNVARFFVQYVRGRLGIPHGTRLITHECSHTSWLYHQDTLPYLPYGQP